MSVSNTKPVKRHTGVFDRRVVVSGLSATGIAAAFFSIPSRLATAQTKPHRIDVHHHVAPPTWLEAVRRAGLDNPPMVNWSPQKSLEAMDKAGIATSVVSPSLPQISFLGREAAAQIARESNEYMAKLAGHHVGRFGVFAMLPMPYVEESLREITHALDVLKADGIGMLTSYGGSWLGDPELLPVFEELNRRKATVYTHPAANQCCVNLVRDVHVSIIEYAADTTRTIASLVLSGRSQQLRDINFIFSHGGGVLTAVIERLEIPSVNAAAKNKLSSAAVDAELARFHYDTAQVSTGVTIRALAQLVPVTQIVFGSDYPYRTPLEHVESLSAAFELEQLKAIERENALRVLPRLRPVLAP